ncbi:copper transporter [Actinomyces trachealis]|uniref:copper transporter n=1 Tax=Actinomyces trachealis TaxID=2763540 RepID=UPI001892926D|nr:copper transporter [Actinomyces trachealis]
MIDFRYHLVSLISVFLALAVGVVLGAGPLQNSLGNALNDQVTQLRQDRQSIQGRLENTEQAVNERDAYITQAANALLPTVLNGQKVALVTLPETDKQDLDSLGEQIKIAGGTVVTRVAMTSMWTDADKASYRSSLAGQLAPYLPGVNVGEGNTALGAGLGKALTTDGEESTILLDLLSDSKAALVTVEEEQASTATMIVVVGPRAKDEPAVPTAPTTPRIDPSQWVSAVRGIVSKATTVALGEAASPTGLVTLLRQEQAAVSTVDSVGQIAASTSTVLALAAVSQGVIQDYGFDKGADAVIPAISGMAAVGPAQPTPGLPEPATEPTGQSGGQSAEQPTAG